MTVPDDPYQRPLDVGPLTAGYRAEAPSGPLDPFKAVTIPSRRVLTIPARMNAALLERLGRELVEAGRAGVELASIEPVYRDDQREGRVPTGEVKLVLEQPT